MPQDDATPAGGQAAQPILPGASSLANTGGGAAVNEPGTGSAAVAPANPAAQPVDLPGAATPSATQAVMPPQSADPFATPAWLQPAPVPAVAQPSLAASATPSPAPVPTPAVQPVNVAPVAASSAVPAPNAAPDPLTGGPIDWDAIAKRFEEQSAEQSTAAPATPVATPIAGPEAPASDVTEPLPTTVEPATSIPQTAASTTPANVSTSPESNPAPIPVIPGLDNGLPDLPAEKPKEKKEKKGGLKAFLEGFGVDLSVLPWNRNKKKQDKVQEDKKPDGGGETLGQPKETPISPAELAAVAALPEKPLVPLAGEPADTKPELTGLEGIPKDLFDPGNLVAPAPLPSPAMETTNGDSSQPPKGPGLGKVLAFFVVLLIVVMGILLLLTQVLSGVNTSPAPTDNNPPITTTTTTSSTTSSSTGVEVPGDQVPQVGVRNIYIYLVALAADPAAIPDGSVQVGDDFLVRVLATENVETTEPVAVALAKLLSIDTEDYPGTDYLNLLSQSGVKALVKEGENGTLIIDIQGKFTVASADDYYFAKQQIERTIENYTFNYTLTYNGSEQDWRNLGN